MRVVTWNVWGRYRPWPEREAAIVATLQDARPDVVVLTESWSKGGDSQCARLAGSNDNPWATQLLWPGRRIDYIFSANPRPGGAGHALQAALLGTKPVNDTYPSDHYALQADLRY
jgi:hypothetical protein